MPTNPTPLSPQAAHGGERSEQLVHDTLLSAVTKLMFAIAAEPGRRTALVREARLELDALLHDGLGHPDGRDQLGGQIDGAQ